MTRTYRQTLLSLVGSLALLGGASFAVSAQAREGAIIAAISSDVPTLDASADSSPNGYNVRLNIYDQLTEVMGDGSVVPRLATSWQVSPDQKTWTFTIRKGTKFHNGDIVTADDVRWTFQKILDDPTAPLRPFFTKLTSVSQVGDDQVRFDLSEPFSLFERPVALVSILPRKAYEAMGPAQFAKTPIGSGPYRLVRWVKDTSIEMEAFPDYWGGAPKLKTAILMPVPSDASRAAALLSGEIDIAPALPPALVASLSNRPGITVGKADGAKSVFVGFNIANPLLNNLKLRMAIDHAIDRDALTGRLLRGLGRPSGQVVSSMFFGYDPKIQPTGYDPALARQLIQESGYKGEPIPFQYPTTFISSSGEVAEAVAGYLKAVGINVVPQPMEWNTFFPLWVAGKISGMYLFAYGSTMLDADATLAGLYESGSRSNWFGAEVDALSKQQRAESDPAKRKALISQIWVKSKANAVYVVLYNEVQAFGLGRGVSWSPEPDGVLRFRDIPPKAAQ